MARDPEREARRLARRDRSLQAHANRIAGDELRKRIKHTLDEIERDRASGRRVGTEGLLLADGNPVTPPNENEEPWK